MLRACAIDFKGSWEDRLPFMEFAYNNSYQQTIKMAPFEALYGRKCPSPLYWDEIGERKLTGPELVQTAVESVKIIKERMRAAQHRQKRYVNHRRRPLEFAMGDKVFLKVSLWRGIIRFGVKAKLRPRYIGPFEILERIGEATYRLALPPKLSHVHNVFHVSMLRKYEPDSSHVVSYEEIEVNEDATYVEEPVQIVGREERKLRNREIPVVKVIWRHHGQDEATWELEAEIRKHYPHLFSV